MEELLKYRFGILQAKKNIDLVKLYTKLLRFNNSNKIQFIVSKYYDIYYNNIISNS